MNFRGGQPDRNNCRREQHERDRSKLQLPRTQCYGSAMGSTYLYDPVSLQMWRDFQEAESKGQFVWYQLRADPTIRCVKVTP